MARMPRILTRSRWARTNADLLVNNPDGFPSGQAPVWWLGSDSPSSIGATTPGNALAAVGRATSLISETIGSLPFRVRKQGPDGSIEYLPPPRWVADPMLLRADARFGARPAGKVGALSPAEFYSQLVVSLLWYGNGYLLFPRADPLAAPLPPLTVINPLDVGIDTAGETPIYKILEIPLEPDGSLVLAGVRYELLHIRGLAPFDEVGLGSGVLTRHAAALDQAAVVRAYARSTFRTGVPGGYLQVASPNLTKAQADDLRADWISKHGNDERSIAVLNSSVTFHPIALSPVDAQLVEAMQFSLLDIALAFGVEPSMLGAPTDANTYANVESRMLQFQQFTLLPWVRRLEDALSSLMPQGQWIEIDIRGLLRADTATRTASYQIMHSIGALTVNEIRRLESLEPLPEPEPVPDPEPVAVEEAQSEDPEATP